MATKITKVKYFWSFNNMDDIHYSGFEETENFGATGSQTQFYLRLDRNAELSLLLASCSQKKLHITKFKVDAYNDVLDQRVTRNLSGEISLDRSDILDCSLFDHFDIFEHPDSSWDVNCIISYKEPPTKTDHKHKLTEQLAAFRLKDAHSDVTLVTVVDGKEHPAHKFILSVRSPVFAAMFKHEGLVENVKKRVEIEGVAGEVMEVFLDFIYSGDVSKVDQFIGELFELADKYDIQSLVQASIEAISVDNVAQLYYLTDLHQQEELKKKTMRFICENKKSVKESNGWSEFIKSNAPLLDQLIDYL